MKKKYIATNLPGAPDAERRSRMGRYALAQGIRLACIGACFLVSGWWLLIPAVGAVFLPYFAVVTANSVRNKSARGSEPDRPGGLVPSDQA